MYVNISSQLAFASPLSPPTKSPSSSIQLLLPRPLWWPAVFSKRCLYVHGWLHYLLVNGQCTIAIRLPAPSAAVTAHRSQEGARPALISSSIQDGGTCGTFVPFAFCSFNSGVCWEPCRKETWVAKELWLLRHQLLAGKASGGRASLNLL